MQAVDLPRREDRLCTAVAILLDTSTSMLHTVRDGAGRDRPKQECARQALGEILDRTAEWLGEHPDLALEAGIYRFSSGVSTLVPMGPFDAARAKQALAKTHASSGTAIGLALEAAYKALYATGCVRKHIVCITDGENTSGPAPELVARRYHAATQGAVAIHMVAFDTSSERFRFLQEVNGAVVQANDEVELHSRLLEIYDRRIFAEALPSEAAPTQR